MADGTDDGMEDWKLSGLETLLAKGSRDREGASTAEVSLLAKGSRDREVAPTEEVCDIAHVRKVGNRSSLLHVRVCGT